MIKGADIALKIFAVIAVSLLLARALIVSGWVQSVLDAPVGDSINMSLQQFFSVGDGEGGEGFVIDVVITISFIFVVFSYGLLSYFIRRMLRSKV